MVKMLNLLTDRWIAYWISEDLLEVLDECIYRLELRNILIPHWFCPLQTPSHQKWNNNSYLACLVESDEGASPGWVNTGGEIHYCPQCWISDKWSNICVSGGEGLEEDELARLHEVLTVVKSVSLIRLTRVSNWSESVSEFVHTGSIIMVWYFVKNCVWLNPRTRVLLPRWILEHARKQSIIMMSI